MKNMSLDNLQIHLDIVKWHKSENEGRDMCRYLEYCEFCKWEDEYKCARPYLRMVEAEEKQAEETNKKAKAEVEVSKKSKPTKRKVAKKSVRIEDEPEFPEIVKAYQQFAKANKGKVLPAVEIKKGAEKIYGSPIKRCYPAFFSDAMISYKPTRPSLFVPQGFSEKMNKPIGPYLIP